MSEEEDTKGKLGETLHGLCFPCRAAPGERILEEWGGGRFAFAMIVPKGVHIGYGVTCGLHTILMDMPPAHHARKQ